MNITEYIRDNKLVELNHYLGKCRRVIVAFSGGVDSSLLLKLARDQLGLENVLAATAVSALIPESEIEAARIIASELGVKHVLINCNELQVEEITSNHADRCYFCKRHKLDKLTAIAVEQGYDYVLEGSNLSDASDYRPGMRALKEFRLVRSPFLACGLDKADIRRVSRQNGLSNWNLPAQACLASRIPYGIRIDETRLHSIASAEAGLHALGFSQVRVRHHGDIARIELESGHFAMLMDTAMRQRINELIKASGFLYAALDLQGYRTGSLNEGLDFAPPTGKN